MSTQLIYIQMDNQQLFFESNTTIREELSSTPYVRHYMQEESFTPHAQGPKVDLPFNHIINQIVSELSIMNKLIAGNSKLTTSLLENGRDIYLKKRQYFDEFRHEYSIIGDTLALMPPEARLIFEYSAMALSNLILKLSINMAKISIVVVSRFLTPSYLNLFTVALLFEKYLELQLVRGKKFASPEDHRHFLKQFPKITVIRLSKKRNPYDLEFFMRSQAQFNKSPFSNKSGLQMDENQVCNVQLLEFFEYEDVNVLMTLRSPSTYSRNSAFNLKQTFGIVAPFGFQLLFLFSQIAIPKMVDFKPDVIIFVEDFDEDVPSVDARVRGLIVNQISEKVQHKIYIFKEFGITQNMKMDWLNEHQVQQEPEFSWKFFQQISKTLATTNSSSFLEESDKFSEERRFCIDAFLKQNMLITSAIFKKLQDCQKLEYRRGTVLGLNSKEPDSVFGKKLSQLHKTALEDLTYLSLALIQKSNFQETLSAYRNYIFPTNFLQKTIFWLTDQLKQIESERVFSEVGEGIKSKIEKLKGMRCLSGLPKLQIQPKETKFYNFFNCKEEQLSYISPNDKQLKQLIIIKEDTFYVAYVQNYVILFLFSDAYYGIYRKKKHEEYFSCVREQQYKRNLALSKKYSTCIDNGKYFYKAFGEAANPQNNTQSEIYRIQIERPQLLEQKEWNKVGNTCLQFSTTDKSKKLATIPLQFKRHGYGFSYQTYQNQRKVSITIFGGGYNFKIQNEEKINRYFYVIRDNSTQIFKIGKTNGQIINENQNMRSKVLIYPFVFGIPILTSSTEYIILNTNAYLQNINHFKKLFLTKMRTGPITSLSSIGITAQNKLDYNCQSPQIAMANKNTILSYIVNSYNRVNRFGNKIAIYNTDGEILVMECLKATQADKFDIIRVEPINSREMSENQDTLSIYFASKKMIPK